MNKIQQEAENNLANDPKKYLVLALDNEWITFEDVYNRHKHDEIGAYIDAQMLKAALQEAEEEIGYEEAEVLHRQMDAEYKRAVAPTLPSNLEQSFKGIFDEV